MPKQLITSEAVHEAVVKVFVAAGFNKIGNCNYGSDIGAGGLGVSMRVAGGVIENPLTIQQLFTAENGLQWPDWANCIIANEHAVYFNGGCSVQFISGSFIGAGSVLATRQPKEKEVKAIKDAVIDHNGKWLGESEGCKLYRWNNLWIFSSEVYPGYKLICDQQEYESEAKRMGYINGYRYGVEYPTNGKRPDLPDDVLIQAKCKGYPNFGNDFKVGNMVDIECESLSTHPVSFKITDPRYKPADTSYLNAQPQDQSLTHSEEGLTHSWHERGELPPIGEHCEYKAGSAGDYSKCTFVGINSNKNFVIEVYGKYSSYHESQIKFRPIRTEREKFIDAALVAIGQPEILEQHVFNCFGLLFDAGFRGPKAEK